jgi:hypothetical protein
MSPAPVVIGRPGRDRGPQTLIQDARAVLSGVLGEYHELIAAMATQDVVPAEVAPNETDKPAQHLVSGLVTVRVVDLLEMIDVADSNGQDVLVTPLPRKLAGQHDRERPAI